MRIVLDTNVLVSGLLTPHGPPGRIVDAVLHGGVTLLVDDRIVSEYREVLARPTFGFDPADVTSMMAFVDAYAERIDAAPLDLSLDDADDLPFIEVARSGRADMLVTGNPRHFRSAAALAVHVVSAAAMLEVLRTSGSAA